MKQDQLFHKTAFGGFNQKDVLDYLTQMNQLHRQELEDCNVRIREQSASISELQRELDAAKKDLQAKVALAAKNAAAVTERDELRLTVEQLRKENEQLRAEKEELQTRDTEADAKEAESLLADARRQAEEILLQARTEAQAIMTEAEEQTDSIARQISEDADDIISMTVTKAQGILNSAQEHRTQMLDSSAKSIGKIKGRLSSMQMVIKHIENELKSARENITGQIHTTGGKEE